MADPGELESGRLARQSSWINNHSIDSSIEAGKKLKLETPTGVTDEIVAVASDLDSQDADSIDAINKAQLEGEIVYRTLTWQKTALLLFTEYVCLAILSFPWIFSQLGMAGGVIATLLIGLVSLYTSLNLWRYCLRHPQMLNICDIGFHIFGKNRFAYEFTAVALILNNVFLQGFHTLTGSKILNTLSDHGTCSLVFSLSIMAASILLTLPRKLEHVASLGMFSAVTMGISILLVLIFHGIQGRHPAVPNFDQPVYITAWAPKGTTFVDGFNAVLNIVFTFTGQICYPTFISEMKDPKEFPKALYALTAMELVVFTTVGIVVYYYTGQYTQAPAVITLKPIFRKIAFAFVLPATIIIGALYASVLAKFVFGRMFLGTRHYNNNTGFGWMAWTGCIVASWIAGWAIGEVIPFFATLTSLMSALFSSMFGYIFWAFAFFEIHRGCLWKGQNGWQKAETVFQFVLIGTGLFIMGPGLYVSVESILQNYRSGGVRTPFSCADNSL